MGSTAPVASSNLFRELLGRLVSRDVDNAAFPGALRGEVTSPFMHDTTGGSPMITALVLLRVERDKVNSVAEELADMKGITEVYSVAGRYDLVAIIRVKENEQLAELVTNHIRKVGGSRSRKR